MLVKATLYSPPDIDAGIIAGDLFRNGSVVRNKLGVIVAHLDEVADFSSVADEASTVAAGLRGTSNKPVIVVACVTGLVIAAGVTLTVVRHRNRKQTSANADVHGSALAKVVELPGRADERRGTAAA